MPAVNGNAPAGAGLEVVPVSAFDDIAAVVTAYQISYNDFHVTVPGSRRHKRQAALAAEDSVLPRTRRPLVIYAAGSKHSGLSSGVTTSR